MVSTNARTREEVIALVQELERRQKTARDLVVENSDIRVTGDAELELPGPFDSLVTVGVTPTAVGQLLAKSNIPAEYGRRILASHPGLFANSVNTLLPKDGKSLVRQLDNAARAILSDRYRPLDNYDLFFNTFDVARKVGAEISRATLHDDRFEMRFVVPDWREQLNYDDQTGGHQFYRGGGSSFIPGAYVSNSETGKGGLTVRPFILDEVCSNGLLVEQSLRQIHLGGQLEIGFLSQEARTADAKAIWLKVRDLVQLVFNREEFKAVVARFRETGLFTLESPVEAVDLIVKDNGLTVEDRQAILNELVSPSHNRQAGPTVLALINAVTQRAQAYHDSDPDKATELEALGGKLLAEPARTQLVAVRVFKREG